MYDMMNSMVSSTVTKNNLSPFKEYLDSNSEIGEYVSAISYGYNVTPYIYSEKEDGTVNQD